MGRREKVLVMEHGLGLLVGASRPKEGGNGLQKAHRLQRCCKVVAVSAEQGSPRHLLSWGSCHEATNLARHG